MGHAAVVGLLVRDFAWLIAVALSFGFVGLLIDPFTGAMWTLPKHVGVTLPKPQPATTTKVESTEW